MNSIYYDVPQSRERLIFIGSKNKIPTFPEPNNNLINVTNTINTQIIPELEIDYMASQDDGGIPYYIDQPLQYGVISITNPDDITPENYWAIRNHIEMSIYGEASPIVTPELLERVQEIQDQQAQEWIYAQKQALGQVFDTNRIIWYIQAT